MRSSPSAKIILVLAAASYQLLLDAAENQSPPVKQTEKPTNRAISEAEAQDFIRGYYAALERGDLQNLINKFAEPTDYLGQGKRNRAYIATDLQRYTKRWSERNLAAEAIVISSVGDGKAKAAFTLFYSISNGSNRQVGQNANEWLLTKIDGQLKIASQVERVSGESPPLSGSTATASTSPPKEPPTRSIDADTEVEIPTAKAKTKGATASASVSPAQEPEIVIRKALPVDRAARKPRKLADFVVALDIGHSPLRGGAVSARGVFEYEFNRRLVLELFNELQSVGMKRSFIINPEGKEISLYKRAALANQQKADLFLAIHHDSVKDRFLKDWKYNGKTEKYCDDFHGYSVFYSRKNAKPDESLAFALKLGEVLLNAGFTPTLHHVDQEHRPIVDKEKGVYAFDDLIVLKTATIPAVLLECGVIVNRDEEERLNSDGYRKRLVTAIDRAIQEFVGVETLPQKP